MTKKKRESAVKAAVRVFQKESGLTRADGMETALVDLMADLMHLCDTEKMDFKRVARRAVEHWANEKEHAKPEET